MRWLFVGLAAYLGYLYGKNEATLKTVVSNQDRIEGASDILTGVKKVFG